MKREQYIVSVKKDKKVVYQTEIYYGKYNRPRMIKKAINNFLDDHGIVFTINKVKEDYV